jgi:ABC-type Fe3+-hydroxamate transport system substrate-binding protein
MMGRKLEIDFPPHRIISLVPSQTELLFDLGLNNEVIACTSFCVHPSEKISRITKIGGTKKLNIQKIKSLNPDLIIANKEENQKDQVEVLADFAPVWVSDISTVQESLSMIQQVGELCGKANQAIELCKKIELGFKSLPVYKGSVLYLIWRRPWMAAGTDTFISDILVRCGFENAIKKVRYPAFQNEDMAAINPDFVFLSSEPYPFTEKHIKEVEALFPNSIVKLVDGEMFSWYGSRIRYAPAYLKTLL